MIRTLIVDDEPLARRAVAAPLQAQPDFTMVAEVGHGQAAVDAIARHRPDLVFLDVQMPEMSGFDVIAAVGVDAMPLTVFVTAFDAYAVQAFEAQALDYLLKPFDDLRFARMLDRVRKHHAAGGAGRNGMHALLGNMGPPKLVARAHGKVQLIRLDEIDWIAAAGDYAEVHAQGRALLLNESLASLEARLPASDFARIHRSAIVRLGRMAALRPGAHGDAIVQLACGTELRLSRRYRDAVDRYLAH